MQTRSKAICDNLFLNSYLPRASSAIHQCCHWHQIHQNCNKIISTGDRKYDNISLTCILSISNKRIYEKMASNIRSTTEALFYISPKFMITTPNLPLCQLCFHYEDIWTGYHTPCPSKYENHK